MDNIINPSGGFLSDAETKFFESLLSGTIPKWLQARLNEGTVDGETRVCGREKAAVAQTLNNHTAEAPACSPDTQATDKSSPSPSEPMFATMPLNGIPTSQAMSSFCSSAVAVKSGDIHATMSQTGVGPTDVASLTKKRARDEASVAQAKRSRHWDENIDPHLQAEEEVFGPHSIGPSFLTSVSLPLNINSTAGLQAPGLSTGGPGLVVAATPNVTAFNFHGLDAIIPATYILTTTPAATSSDSVSAGGVPVPAERALTAPKPPPAAQMVTVPKGRQSRSGNKTYRLKPITKRVLEDSDDDMRQKTINAHRANDARENDTDDIICLWQDAGADQPCHLSLKGTDALLAHCVMKHGVPSSKDVKERGACGWNGCPASDMRKGGLKRHLEESFLHGRRERVKYATTVEAEVKA